MIKLPEFGTEGMKNFESNPYTGENFLLFKTRNGGRYLYDSATGTVHPWDWSLREEETQKIYETENSELSKLEFMAQNPELFYYINLWRNHTDAFYARKDLPKASIMTGPLALKNKSNPSLYSDLVLIVTEACNHRCKYCTFSGIYSGYRDHGNAVLKYEDACKAVDYFFEINDQDFLKAAPGRKINIVFYGGEPLMEYKLIEKVIRYAIEHNNKKYNLDFSVVTNLTLLDDDMLDFFHKNDISLSVSLDGPKNEHDRYRCFSNGEVAFDKVMEKFKMIREKDIEYYRKRVGLNITITWNSNMEDILEFFNSNSDLPKVLFMGSLKDAYECGFYDKYPYSPGLYEERMKRVFSKYLNLKKEGKKFYRGDFFYSLFEEGLEKFYERTHIKKLPFQKWFTAACYPGRKLALAPDRCYYICERVNYAHPIGNVDTGLDDDKILKVLDAYNKKLPDCNCCWARNSCPICYAAVLREENFDFKNQCNISRLETASQLVSLYTLLELSPHAFLKDDDVAIKNAGG